MSLFVWAVAIFGMSNVWAATNTGFSGASTADLIGSPETRTKTSVNYEKYETRSTSKTYAVKDNNDIYYVQPSKRSDLYKEYDSRTSSSADRTSRTASARNQAQRKYFLSHPFFQPTKGKFGSVTDLSYTSSSYDFVIDQTSGPALSDLEASWEMAQFAIKEDISYGITDNVSFLGMARFDNSEYKMDWSTAPDDKMTDSGVNVYGLGLQWRFVDTSEWIANVSGYYQRQSDLADFFALDLKAGYKLSSSTIYGLARGWMVGFDGNSYGNGISADDAALFIAYSTGDSNAVYLEGGLGMFTVLEDDWTLNLEAIVGNYDWHNQGYLKAAIGWQPYESFALNLYGKISVYDSADSKDLDFYWYEPAAGVTELTNIGTANIDNNSEMSFGLQAIFYF